MFFSSSINKSKLVLFLLTKTLPLSFHNLPTLLVIFLIDMLCLVFSIIVSYTILSTKLKRCSNSKNDFSAISFVLIVKIHIFTWICIHSILHLANSFHHLNDAKLPLIHLFCSLCSLWFPQETLTHRESCMFHDTPVIPPLIQKNCIFNCSTYNNIVFVSLITTPLLMIRFVVIYLHRPVYLLKNDKPAI